MTPLLCLIEPARREPTPSPRWCNPGSRLAFVVSIYTSSCYPPIFIISCLSRISEQIHTGPTPPRVKACSIELVNLHEIFFLHFSLSLDPNRPASIDSNHSSLTCLDTNRFKSLSLVRESGQVYSNPSDPTAHPLGPAQARSRLPEFSLGVMCGSSVITG